MGKRAVVNVWQRAGVNFDDRRDECASATDEGFVCDVEFGEVNGALFEWDVEFFGKLDDGAAVNTFKDVAGGAWREQFAATYDEDVGSRKLCNMAVTVEEYTVIVAAIDSVLAGEDGIDIGTVNFGA